MSDTDTTLTRVDSNIQLENCEGSTLEPMSSGPSLLRTLESEESSPPLDSASETNSYNLNLSNPMAEQSTTSPVVLTNASFRWLLDVLMKLWLVSIVAIVVVKSGWFNLLVAMGIPSVFYGSTVLQWEDYRKAILKRYRFILGYCALLLAVLTYAVNNIPPNNFIYLATLLSYICVGFSALHGLMNSHYVMTMNRQSATSLFLSAPAIASFETSSPLKWDPWVVLALPWLWLVLSIVFLILAVLAIFLVVMLGGGSKEVLTDPGEPVGATTPVNRAVLGLLVVPAAIGGYSLCKAFTAWRPYLGTRYVSGSSPPAA